MVGPLLLMVGGAVDAPRASPYCAVDEKAVVEMVPQTSPKRIRANSGADVV